jgi:NitT/TauT family transport system permease protein
MNMAVTRRASGARPKSRSLLTDSNLTAVPIHLYRLLVVLSLLAIWEGCVRFGLVNGFWIGQPTLIAKAFMLNLASSHFYLDLAYTMAETVAGFVAGCVIGISLGFALALYHGIYRVFEPLIMAFYSLPRVALAPLFVLWFGIGALSKIALSVSIVFLVLLLNTYQGVRSVDRDLLNSTLTMGASRSFVIRNVIVPWSIPWILTGARISIGLSLMASVVGEMMSSQYGVGHLLDEAQGAFDTNSMFALLVYLGLLAIGLNTLMQYCERRWAYGQ